MKADASLEVAPVTEALLQFPAVWTLLPFSRRLASTLAHALGYESGYGLRKLARVSRRQLQLTPA